MTVSLDAATLTVTSTADHGSGTLREALAIAADGDTIDATGISGIILLTSGELLLSKSLSILGGGPDKLAVDGNAASRVFHVTNGVTVTISGLTITNANNTSEKGGGIYNERATLAVSNCTISGTIYGSGICNFSGAGAAATLIIARCNFIGNHGGAGGAVWNVGDRGNAKLSVSDCFFSANSGGYGGGIANDGGSVEIVNSTFTGNVAYGTSGGGVWNGGTLSISNSIINSNSAVDVYGFINFVGGGGLMNEGAATIATTIFSSNSVRSDAIAAYFLLLAGGGINNLGTMNLINCTLSDNRVAGRSLDFNDIVIGIGGGIHNAKTMMIAGTTIGNFANNDNMELPSGIVTSDEFYTSLGLAGDAALTIVNSTMENSDIMNFASGGTLQSSILIIRNSTLRQTDLRNTLGLLQIGSSILAASSFRDYVSGQVISLGHNLSTDNGRGFLTHATDLINTDPLLGPLQDNGGPTLNHALLPGSPAIDRGSNFTGSATDQRGTGFARTVDDPFIANALGGDGTDIGAFEVQQISPPKDSDGDGITDDVDECPGTRPGDIVGSTGCSIAQLVPCNGPRSGGRWRNRGQYVQAVVRTATQFLRAGLITRKEWARIVTDAAHSRSGWSR